MPFSVGQKVKARHAGKFMYRPAVITGVAGDLYDVKWEDARTETAVPADRIIPALTEEEREEKNKALLEEQIKEFAPPVVTEKKFVPRRRPEPPRPRSPSPGSPRPEQFAVGQKIEARYKGRGSKYFPGMITAVTPAGYSIRYEDEDEETGASPENIRQRILMKFKATHGECSKMSCPKNSA